jgi:uncharacterized protein (DUF427 family)
VRPPRPDPVGPGQESVWDYPRPPSAEVGSRHVVVELGGRVVADTVRAIRVCETSHPPVYYVPREDVADGRRVRAVGWSYEDPSSGFEQLRGAVAFYPGRVDRATVDGEQVRPQAGDFYGGWITDEVVGPFKGEPGTSGW